MSCLEIECYLLAHTNLSLVSIAYLMIVFIHFDSTQQYRCYGTAQVARQIKQVNAVHIPER